MSFRWFADLDFGLVGPIEPECGPDGQPREFMPQSRYRHAATTPLNAAGAGPFCRFKIGKGRNQPGLYVLTIDGEATYVGECANLAVRWGLTQYGSISPKNCFRGGQSTNCRINGLILLAAKAGRTIQLWFRPLLVSTDERRGAETRLIQALKPNWNRTKLALR